jgi:hypothetical protein
LTKAPRSWPGGARRYRCCRNMPGTGPPRHAPKNKKRNSPSARAQAIRLSTGEFVPVGSQSLQLLVPFPGRSVVGRARAPIELSKPKVPRLTTRLPADRHVPSDSGLLTWGRSSFTGRMTTIRPLHYVGLEPPRSRSWARLYGRVHNGRRYSLPCSSRGWAGWMYMYVCCCCCFLRLHSWTGIPSVQPTIPGINPTPDPIRTHGYKSLTVNGACILRPIARRTCIRTRGGRTILPQAE